MRRPTVLPDQLRTQTAVAAVVLLAIVGAGLFSSAPAHADVSTTTGTSNSTLKGKVDPQSLPPVFGSVGYEYGGSAVDSKDGSLQAFQSLFVGINRRLGKDWIAGAKISVDQDLRYSDALQGNGISDLALGLSQMPQVRTSWLSTTSKYSVVLPASNYSQSQLGLEASAGADVGLLLTPSWMSKDVMLSLGLGGSRNFHKYSTDASGNILNPWSVREDLFAGYSLGKFFFDIDFLHRSAFSYNNDISESFEHTEEAAYSFTPAWRMALGHTNRGSWLGANGVDSNLKLIDPNASIFYVMVAWKF